jgi:hypothetical protein
MIHNLYKEYKKFNIYKITKNKDDFLFITFYISRIKQKYKDINDKSFSFIQYIVDIKKKDATLIVLKTNNIYKNKGYATKLLQDSLNYLKNIKIQKIELDDMSDHSWEDHNIYISFGFKYINEFPEPEMILLINK